MVFERKSMPMVAWYALSKVSYMKRVISDVLPTADQVDVKEKGIGWHVPLCSPRNTSLNFFSG